MANDLTGIVPPNQVAVGAAAPADSGTGLPQYSWGLDPATGQWSYFMNKAGSQSAQIGRKAGDKLASYAAPKGDAASIQQQALQHLIDTQVTANAPAAAAATAGAANNAPTNVAGSGIAQALGNPSGHGGYGGADTGHGEGWSGMSDADKASYYAEHPNMAALTQFGQSLFGVTGLGALQQRLDPGFAYNQGLIAKGIDPGAASTLQSSAEDARLARADAQVAAATTPDQSSAEAARLARDNAQAPDTSAQTSAEDARLARADAQIAAAATTPATDQTSAEDARLARDQAAAAAAATPAPDQTSAEDARLARDQAAAAAPSTPDAPTGGGGGGGDTGGGAQSNGNTGGDNYGHEGSRGDGGGNGATGGLAQASKITHSRFAKGGPVGGLHAAASLPPRFLRGPGDGQSDSIPVQMSDGGQGRLADNEFVIPADAVSALGSGSSEAGARALYEMVDRIRQTAHGKKTQAKPVDPRKVMPI